MKINVAKKNIIDKILQRKNKVRHYSNEVDLGEVLEEILLRADEFVPSDSGSILLDDPLLKWDKNKEGRLYFLACFGSGSEALVGTYLPDNVGIVGSTYKEGRPYLSQDVQKDGNFYSDIDKKTNFESKSIIALPIMIENSVIGVLELINRKNKVNFSHKDVAILDIFARYTSTLITNALDARRFGDLSKKDNLTGLYNDRYFFEMLFHEVKTAIDIKSDVSLIFFDLDHFKEVNDTHGHLAGSKVLKEVAIIVEEIFVGTEAAPARYGGDEFVIIMPGTSLKDAAILAEKIRAAIESNTFIPEGIRDGGPPLNIKGLITCSVGVASLVENIGIDEGIVDMEGSLLSAADRAMYKAKDLGKNRVFIAECLKK